jgi:hypothetical protein
MREKLTSPKTPFALKYKFILRIIPSQINESIRNIHSSFGNAWAESGSVFCAIDQYLVNTGEIMVVYYPQWLIQKFYD